MKRRYFPVLNIHVTCNFTCRMITNSNGEVYKSSRDPNHYIINIDNDIDFIDKVIAIRHEVGHVVTEAWLKCGEKITLDGEVYQYVQDDIFRQIMRYAERKNLL